MSELVRYEWPGTSLAPMFEDFFADGFFDRRDRDFSGSVWPRVDIIERHDSYMLKADLPGLEKDDISISVDNGTLTIGGRKEATKRETRKGSYYHLERSYGSFCRSFMLPPHVDGKKVEAHFKNGVIEITLRKTKTGESAAKATDVKIS
jgi:HSP20 family protein